MIFQQFPWAVKVASNHLDQEVKQKVAAVIEET